MSTEIERKFLVQGSDWQQSNPKRLVQGYLNRDKHRTVRVRIAGDAAFLTIKGITTGSSRSEFEYTIPVPDADHLLTLCEGPMIEKLRHEVTFAGMLWEVDEFLGLNAGLVVAEIELERADQEFRRPEWLSDEVTHDARYLNSNLSSNPFSTWK